MRGKHVLPYTSTYFAIDGILDKKITQDFGWAIASIVSDFIGMTL